MPESKQTNWFPWLAVAALAYFAFVRQPAVEPIDPQPQPKPSQSISKVVQDIHKSDLQNRIQTLKEFAGKEFASDPEALKWYNDTITARRIENEIPYTDRVGKAMKDGKVKELAAELEAGK